MSELSGNNIDYTLSTTLTKPYKLTTLKRTLKILLSYSSKKPVY